MVRPSGFFISEDGLLVTNYHVAGGADEVELRFDGSTETTSAKVLGGSACADIALIQAEGGPYEYLEWAPDVPKLEEAIRVVGFPRGTQTISFQDGRVSKEISDDIEVGGFLTNFESSARTDFGNSGGPVVNSIGEVLGVHYAAEWGNPRHLAGVEAREVVDSILNGPVIDPGFQIIDAYRRTLDGVTGNTLDIGTVRPGSPADTRGLGFGDEIVVFDGIVPQDDFGGARMVCDAILDNAGRTPMDIVVYRWQDETLWDGQLFGEPLALRPDPYVLGTDDGSIAVTVPGRWTDKKDIEEPGRDWVGYWAAPRLEGDGGYFDAFGRSPGMRLMWSAEKANTHTSAQHLEGLSYAAQASGPIAPFAANGLTGHFQRFSFGGKAAVEYAFTLDGVEDSPLFMLFVADAAHRIDVTVGRMLDTLQFTMPEPDSDG